MILTPLLHPVPLVILTTKDQDRINHTTIGDVAIAGLQPPLLMVSLHERHLSTKWMRKHASFSVNVPTTEHLEKVKYCGQHSGHQYDKSNVFVLSDEADVSVVAEMPISMVCRVLHEVSEKGRVVFVARVIKTILREPLETVNALLYGLDDCYYKAERL